VLQDHKIYKILKKWKEITKCNQEKEAEADFLYEKTSF
jgi:hypothetical protein